jgi:hypothetical protein
MELGLNIVMDGDQGMLGTMPIATKGFRSL